MNLSSVQQLDDLLSQNFSASEWSEYFIDHARKLLKNMCIEDWRAMEQLWVSKDEEWQVKFGQILDSVEQEHAIPILLKMCRSTKSEVVLRAADKLRHMNLSNTKLSKDVIMRLESVAKENKLSQIVITDFLRKSNNQFRILLDLE